MARRDHDNSTKTPPRENSPDDGPPSHWWVWLAAIVLALAAFAVYKNSLSAEFVLDDHNWIEDNVSIRQLWPLGPIFEPARSEELGGRPVVSLSLALNYALGGTSPWGYHVVNLAIHILATWTFFGLIRRTLLLPSIARRFASAATPLAFAAALIWAVHPLQTQAVTYVIQRTESLASLFYLLTLYCVLRGATASRAALAWYVAAVFSCLLGAGTKEIIATAPLVVLLYDRAFLGGSFGEALARRWGLYIGLLTSWIATYALLVATNFHGGSTGLKVEGFTPLSYLLTQPGVLVHYLRLAFWPSGQCLDYGWPAAHTAMQIIPPGLVIVALLALTVWALVKQPALGFLGACFFLILAPTSSIVPIKDAAFEHRMYLPLAAIAVLVVLGAWALWLRVLPEIMGSSAADEPILRWATPLAVLAAVSVALGWATVRRNEQYRHEIVILQDAINKSPDSPRALTNFAFYLNAQGKGADAEVYLNRALAIDPNFLHAIVNLGRSLVEQGKLDEAMEQYKKWIVLDPKSPEPYYNMGLVYRNEGKNDLAIEQYEHALAIKPDHTDAMDDLAIALFREHKNDQALAMWSKAIEIDPKFADARNNYGVALYELHKPEQAIDQFRRAVEINPQLSKARDRLAEALHQQGETAEAIDQWRALLKFDPRNVKARIRLGLALHQEGRKQEAIDQWREAIQFATPADAPLLFDTMQALAFGSDKSLHNSGAAIELGDAAARLTGFQNPEILEQLAAAHANLGQFATASQIARKAFDLAKDQKNFALADRIQVWIRFYNDRAAGREASPPPTAP